MDGIEKIYTVKQAAELLQCHPETLRKAIKLGHLKAAKIGRVMRISQIELEKYWQLLEGGGLFTPQEDTSKLSFVCDTEVKGKLKSGKIINENGQLGVGNKLEGDIDDGIIFAEAFKTTMEHFWMYKIEKVVNSDLSEVTISIRNIKHK